jgi:hypothetical protein
VIPVPYFLVNIYATPPNGTVEVMSRISHVAKYLPPIIRRPLISLTILNPADHFTW